MGLVQARQQMSLACYTQSPTPSNNTTRACGYGKLLWTKSEKKQMAFEGEIKNKNAVIQTSLVLLTLCLHNTAPLKALNHHNEDLWLKRWANCQWTILPLFHGLGAVFKCANKRQGHTDKNQWPWRCFQGRNKSQGHTDLPLSSVACSSVFSCAPSSPCRRSPRVRSMFRTRKMECLRA